MSALFPSLLWGLLAVGLPILLHLLHRKKAVPHAFAATEFVLRLLERAKRRLQWKTWLLMLVRCLLVAAMVLFFSGLFRRLHLAAASGVPKSHVILWDVSGSMRAVSAGTSLFEQRKREIQSLLEAMDAADDVTILVFADQILASSGPLNLDRSPIRAVLNRQAVTARATDVSLALQEALVVLGASDRSEKRIHLFTDFTESGWKGSNFPDAAAYSRFSGLQVLLHGRSELKPLKNQTITGIFLRSDPEQPREAIVDVHLKRNWTGTGEVSVTLSQGGKEIARAFHSYQEDSPAFVTFTVGREGRLDGPIEASLEEDALPTDNHGYAWLTGGGVVRLLAIDGDPQPQPLRSETFFLSRVLRGRASSGRDVQLRSVTIDEWPGVDLRDIDVVLLANVRDLAPREVLRLKKFVEEGGALWITLGDQLDPEVFNRRFQELLPVSVRDVRSEDPPLPMEAFPQDSALLPQLSTSDRQLFEKVRLQRYAVPETKMKAGSRVQWRLANGTPILLSHSVGRGRVLLWLSSLDRQWNNFALQPTYLPFIQAVSRSVAKGLRRPAFEEVEVGKPLDLSLPESTQRLLVRSPEGTARVDRSVALGSATIALDGFEEPGLYPAQFLDPQGKILQQGALWVRLAKAESDLRLISVEDLQTRLPKEVWSVHEDQGIAAKAAPSSRAATYSLMPWIFLGVIGLLGIQTWVESW